MKKNRKCPNIALLWARKPKNSLKSVEVKVLMFTKDSMRLKLRITIRLLENPLVETKIWDSNQKFAKSLKSLWEIKKLTMFSLKMPKEGKKRKQTTTKFSKSSKNYQKNKLRRMFQKDHRNSSLEDLTLTGSIACKLLKFKKKQCSTNKLLLIF